MENELNKCNCDSSSASTSSNIPTYSFNFTRIVADDDCSDEETTRDEMINEIRSLDFACVELAEYLDTHGNDEKALDLHKEYCNKLNVLKDKYQKLFGPLNIYFPCNKWRWLEEPWPWERGNF